MGDLLRQVVSAASPMVVGTGLFFKLIESTGPVTVVFHRPAGATKNASQIEAGYQYGPLPEEARFHKAVITSATTQTIALLLGEEFEDYSRVVGTVQVLGLVQLAQGTVLASRPDAAVGASASIILPANASRRRGIVTAAQANTDDIRVGDSAVTAARGARLQPGQSFTTEIPGDVYAIAISGAQTVELLEELG